MCQTTSSLCPASSAVGTLRPLLNPLTYKINCSNCGTKVKKGSKCPSCGIRSWGEISYIVGTMWLSCHLVRERYSVDAYHGIRHDVCIHLPISSFSNACSHHMDSWTWLLKQLSDVRIRVPSICMYLPHESDRNHGLPNYGAASSRRSFRYPSIQVSFTNFWWLV